ncbi:ParB/RepB/Spo0J family partition protein [Streptomyces sp. NPDC003038]|uniref:ParB/RepB/Spo0J family partition protein n=1 Tax=unclassified Streptomyces TaxID=2593676 RepID=UPI0033AF59B8
MNATPANIPDELLPLAVPVADLTPFHRNPRNGDVVSIRESLTINGQYKAIVVNRGTHTGRPGEILAGNHTFQAAVELGWEAIAATWVDVDDEAATRIVVVDNRTSDLAGYDSALLAEILEELPDLQGTGYDQTALDELLDTSLPAVLPAETIAGEGEKIKDEHLQWGFIQWGTTRVQITADEVERLNTAHTAYYERRGTDSGFGHYLLDTGAAADDDQEVTDA